MSRALIYRYGSKYRVIDTYREVVVGVYDTPHQARQGWGVYEVQGCVGAGFTPKDYDYYVIDVRKELHENTVKAALRRSREDTIEHESERDKEMLAFIERHKG